MHPGRENGSTQGALWLIEMQSVTALDEQLAALGTWTGESFTRGLAATGGFLDATGSGRLSFAVTRDLSATMRDIAVYSYSPLVGSPMWMIGSPTMIVASGTTGDRLAARHLRGRSTACERAAR